MLPNNSSEKQSPKNDQSSEKRTTLSITPKEKRLLKKASKLQSLLLERLLSVKRVAELAEVSKTTIRRAIHDGKLKTLDIGRGKTPIYRIPYFWYLQYISSQLPGGLEEYLEAYEEFEQEEAVEGLEKLASKYHAILRAEGKEEVKKILKKNKEG